MKTQITIILLALFLISCSPKATPTQMPPQKISIQDLDPALLLPSKESLPAGVILSRTSTTFENRDVIEPLSFIYKQMEDATDVRGGINIYVYESPLDMKSSYKTEQESNLGISEKTYTDLSVGETSQVTSYVLGSDQVNDLVFYRCNVLVTVRFLGPDPGDLIKIGNSIDASIQSLVCE